DEALVELLSLGALALVLLRSDLRMLREPRRGQGGHAADRRARERREGGEVGGIHAASLHPSGAARKWLRGRALSPRSGYVESAGVGTTQQGSPRLRITAQPARQLDEHLSLGGHGVRIVRRERQRLIELASRARDVPEQGEPARRLATQPC